MTISRPSPFFSGARDRGRQARFLLTMGLIFALGVLSFLRLPTFYHTLAVADSDRLYLVAMSDSYSPTGPGVVITSSKDAVTWSKPVERPIKVYSAAALDHYCYVLISVDQGKSSQLNAYGPGTWEGQEDWKVIDLPPALNALGISEHQGRLWVFGVVPPPPPPISPAKSHAPAPQSDKKVPLSLHSAFLEDGKWTDGPVLDVPEGVPGGFQLVTDSSGSFLYWRASFPGKWLALLDIESLGPKLYRSRFDGKSFGPVESFDLGPDVGHVLVAQPDRTLLFTQTQYPWWRSARPISLSVIRGGAFTPAPVGPIYVESFRKSSLVEDDFTAVRFGDKDFILLDACYHDLFLSGIYSFRLEDTRALDPVLFISPSPIQISVMVFWCIGVILVLSLLAAAFAGYLRRDLPLEPVLESVSYPPATLMERAVATSLDLAFVSIIPVVMAQIFQRPPAENGIAFLVAWLAYSSILETIAGRTLGKRVVGIQVLDPSGQPPNLASAIIRNLAKPFEFITFGPALILGSRRFQRLGDFLAHTVVVSNPIVPPPPPVRHDDEEGF